jgi:hypothetical protein
MISSRRHRIRIARSLVAILSLTLIQVIASPIVFPSYGTPNANAEILSTTGMIVDWEFNGTTNSYTGSGTTVTGLNSTAGGTLKGSPTHTSGGVGYVTIANGAAVGTQAVWTPDLTSRLNTTNSIVKQNISFFAWIYPTAPGIVVYEMGTADNTGWYDSQMEIVPNTASDGTLKFRMYNGEVLTSSVSISYNNWYYVGMTFDNASATRRLTGYINGQQVAQNTTNYNDREAPFESSYGTYYGVGQGGATNLGTNYGGNFRLAAFHVYNDALSAATVSNNYLATVPRFTPTFTNPSSLPSYENRNVTFTTGTCTPTSSSGSCTYQWQRSTDAGSSWSDISGATASSLTLSQVSTSMSGYRYRTKVTDSGTGTTTAVDLATYSSAATLTVNAQPGGETDTALALNGTNQYAWVADTGTGGVYDLGTTLTMEAWVYPTETSSAMYIVATKVDSFQLFHIDGIWKYAFRPTGTNFGLGLNTLVPVRTNEWHHIAVTRSANTSSFYYDGQLAYTGTGDVAGSSALNDNTYPFVMGGKSYDGITFTYPFKGSIDHFALFDVVRDATNVDSDMDSYLTTSTSNLRAYYDFNEGSGSTLINRTTSATSASDLTILGSPTWNDVKSVSTSSAYTTVKFPRSYITNVNGWKIPSGVSAASALVIAGGGGGGSRVGGGGGAGGYLYVPTLSLTSGSVERITIGQGGFGGRTGNVVANNYQGVSGSNTVLGTRYTTLGGGGGGGYNTASNTGHEGLSGGSGGGAAPHLTTTGTWSAGVGTALQFSTYSYGQGNDGGSGNSGSGGYYPAGGGGGAGGVGATATSSTTAGNGGAGILDPIGGTTLCYAGGGGGGVGNSFGGAGVTVGGAAGTCAGGTSTAGVGSKDEVIGGSALANSGSGGGGSGYQSGNTNTTDKPGGNGGSGVIIVKYLVASSKPIFSGPYNDTTTAGLVETFTVTGTPNDPLVRSYRWQVSTDTGTSWSTPTQGSGWFTASYVTPTLTTAMSGTRYQYRVVVTDTDTAGLTMTETSSAVYLIINPVLVMTGNATINKAINVVKLETFTVTGGTPTLRYTLAPTISGITLDTSTAGSPVVRISETKTVGTYYETLTVTDSASASVIIPLTISVIAPPNFTASADQVISGIILVLDPGSSASYTGTGNTWKDLSGRGVDANLAYANSANDVYADGVSRSVAIDTTLTCAGAAYNSANFGSFEFSTVGQCIIAPRVIPVASVSPVPVYTVSTWIKRNGNQAAWKSINCNPYRNTNDQIFFCLFWASATTLNAGIFNGSAWGYTTALTIPDQTWILATVTYNGGNTLSLYLNDTPTAATNTTLSVTWNSAKMNTGLIIGRKWDASDTFIGSVGEIRVYDRILTTTEIAQNYTATKSRYLSTFNKQVPSKKYGVVATDTYTVISSAPSVTASIALNSRPALKWDTSTARAVTVRGQESLTVGSYLETVTATDNLGQSAYLALTYVVTKADTLTVSMDTATVVTFNGNPITIFPKPVYKGLVGVDTLTITTKFSSTLYSLSATAPTNADTYTVIAADPFFTTGASSNYYNITYETSTAVVNKAKQSALNPSMYGAVVGSPFTLTLLGGSGDGPVTETLTGTSTAPNCAIASHVLTSSATQIAYCQVQFTKATSQNYLAESITVQIYFMIYIINQPSGLVGNGSTIAINGETSITRSSGAPSISGVSASGDATYPIAIAGSGFSGSAAADTVVKFWRGITVNSPDFIIKSDSLIWTKQPVGVTAGKVLVVNSNGTGVSPANFVP